MHQSRFYNYIYQSINQSIIQFLLTSHCTITSTSSSLTSCRIKEEKQGAPN
ncbi:hypothetical protein Syun_012937 [Stephania yunnanensis]|uniref:Uncharacterized protein n=1 Tax=Stephania yunnanensis TaxID=152371 RepID=A0AAP0K2Q1_9MAGN